MTQELDGTYLITTTTSYQGPLQKGSDGTTEIRDGQTERIDENGCKWTSKFRIISESEVEMIAIADPTDAKDDFALTRPNGTPTREPITYTSQLRLQRKENRVQMSGQIQYGDEIIFLTMRKK